MRPSHRQANELRPITLTRRYIPHAEGSVLIQWGNTRVLCTATVTQNSVPRFLKGSGKGWVTAEYSMLPRATMQRTDREAVHGRQTGRTMEIQRLIGRSLRACIDLAALGEHSIVLDCDVVQADGGTRCAAITGGCVALMDAIQTMKTMGILKNNPIKCMVAAVSVGVYQGMSVLDLDYQEDSGSETDMNVVMTDQGSFIELQGTAEQKPFNAQQLMEMTALAQAGVNQIVEIQQSSLKQA